MDYGKAISMGITGSRMSKKEVAIAIGVSANYLYDVCNNRKPPGLNLLENLSNLFNVKLSTLIRYGEQ